MKIIVLAGGLSPERDVSLSSGALISNALIENGHDVLLLDLYLGIKNESIVPEYVNQKACRKYSYQVPEQEPDLDHFRACVDNNDSLIGEGVIKLCKEADVTFLALYGSIGENGKLQAIFDVNGIAYMQAFYKSKCQSKPKMVALVAVMHKMLFIIFAVLRDQKPFEFRDPKEHAARLAAKVV